MIKAIQTGIQFCFLKLYFGDKFHEKFLFIFTYKSKLSLLRVEDDDELFLRYD